jgi:thioredoxin reductase
VRFELGVRAELADILALQPDEVVLATGSTPDWPGWLPAEWRDGEYFPDVRTAAARFVARKQRETGSVLIYDHDHTAFTYATAELLARLYDRVVLVTPREGVAAEEPLVNRQGVHQRLAERKIQVVNWHDVIFDESLLEGQVRLREVRGLGETTVNDVALIVHATPRIPNDQLLGPLRAAGVSVQVIGDCYAPRSLLVATGEGYRCGMSL